MQPFPDEVRSPCLRFTSDESRGVYRLPAGAPALATTSLITYLSATGRRIAIVVQANTWPRRRNFVESGHISILSAGSGWRLPCSEPAYCWEVS
jgi:hypothetical protein